MLVGIGGVSRSGKSLVAQKIKELFPNKTVQIVCQDDYIPQEDAIPRIHGEIDWECPESLDFKKFSKALLSACENNDWVIGEGLMVFYDKNIEGLFDKKIFVEISEDVFRSRKKPDLRWGPFPDWYIGHIWNSFLKFGKIEMGRKDVLYLDGNTTLNEITLRKFLEK